MILPTTHKHAATGVGLPVSAPETDRHVAGNPPLHALSVARSQMIEQIMTVRGRASKNPPAYRRILEGYDFATLQRTWQGLLEKSELEFAHSANATPNVTPLELIDA